MIHRFGPVGCCLLLLLAATAFAQEAGDEAATERDEALDRLLEDVRRVADETAAENAAREAAFGAEQQDRAAVLAETQAALDRETERSRRLRSQFDDNEVRLEELNDTLRVRTGDMGELFGIFRQVAAETAAVIDASLVSAEDPARRTRISTLAETDDVPSIDDLRSLQVLLLEEMVQTGRVSRFPADYSDRTGRRTTGEIVRIGAFNAVSADGYLQSTDAGLNLLPRQPARRFVASARDFFATTAGSAAVAIDPSRGSLLSLVIQTPGIFRQLSYGGGIGYTIILIGLAGLLIAFWRLWSLRSVAGKVAAQLEGDAVSEDNPLGRILSVASGGGAMPVDLLERKLDEAVLRETPLLERYQGIIKVIAGVAPLMGLLGTVVGMIRTFQTITLFGSGDPKLMADGISQALVTTVEGLVVAIPLVFLHALITDRSREVIEILEEQSAGVIARHAERLG